RQRGEGEAAYPRSRGGWGHRMLLWVPRVERRVEPRPTPQRLARADRPAVDRRAVGSRQRPGRDTPGLPVSVTSRRTEFSGLTCGFTESRWGPPKKSAGAVAHLGASAYGYHYI